MTFTLRYAIVLAWIMVFTNTLRSQTVIENWADGDYETGPVTWTVAAGDGVLSFGPAGLTMTSDGVSGPFFLQALNAPTQNGISARTRMTPLSGARAGLGVSEERYFGALQLDGTVRVGQSTIENISAESLGALFGGRIGGSEFYLQWDAFGNRIQAWAWPVGVVNAPVITISSTLSSPTEDDGLVLWTSATQSSADFSEVTISSTHLPIPEIPDFTVQKIAGNGDYLQTFDSLGTDTRRPSLPVGWTGRGGETGQAEFNAINHDFALTRLPQSKSGFGDLYNAGLDGDSDRAFATSVFGTSTRLNGSELTLRAQIEDEAADSLRLQFDIEAWNTLVRNVTPVGEAAFNVYADVDQGQGFKEIISFGKQSTGKNLVAPTSSETVNGNLPSYRTSIDLFASNVSIPVGAQLRLRFVGSSRLGEDSTGGWVFGLDNVRLQLSPQVGDITGDRRVAFEDFLILSEHFGQQGRWGEGDFDNDGLVAFSDFLLLSANYEPAATASLPEPTSGSLWVLLSIVFARRRKRAPLEFLTEGASSGNHS